MSMHSNSTSSEGTSDKQDVPAYSCMRIEAPLTDEQWLSLPNLSLVDVVTGEVPRLQTKVSLCYSEQALHLRFWCLDDHVYSPYTDHDDPLYEADVVECFIDPEGAAAYHYELNLSPHNVVFDAKIINEHGEPRLYQTEWNAEGLETKVEKAEQDALAHLFEAEHDAGTKVLVYDLTIPFADLGATAAPGTEWRMNMFRIDQDQEGVRAFTAWSHTGEIKFHVPARFGRIQFV